MDGPRPSECELARRFGVSQPYVCKVMKTAHAVGWDALVRESGPVTLEEFERARRVTANTREREPDLFVPAPQPRASDEPSVLTVNENIAERWREVAEWKRKNPCDGRLRTMQEWQERSGRRRTG